MKKDRGRNRDRENVHETPLAGEISVNAEGAGSRDDAEISGPAGTGGTGPRGHGEPRAMPRSKAEPTKPGGESTREKARWTGDRAATGGNKTGPNKTRRG
jgi:hypothetical protein